MKLKIDLPMEEDETVDMVGSRKTDKWTGEETTNKCNCEQWKTQPKKGKQPWGGGERRQGELGLLLFTKMRLTTKTIARKDVGRSYTRRSSEGHVRGCWRHVEALVSARLRSEAG